MNKQGNKANPSGGIEWTHIFGPGTGYTANPVRGCQHECRWRMPDGKEAQCYAKTVAERFGGVGTFEHVTWHPEVLDKIRAHKAPAGIFIESMSDLFAQTVPSDWVQQVLSVMIDCPQHRFFTLTKNPTRLIKIANYPRNLLLGVSMPPTFMFGHELTPVQQKLWFAKALESLCATDAKVKWVSLEPLSWDCSELLWQYRNKLNWAVIGAASDGAKTYQPENQIVRICLQALAGLPVFFKGNLTFEPHREEFPTI